MLAADVPSDGDAEMKAPPPIPAPVARVSSQPQSARFALAGLQTFVTRSKACRLNSDHATTETSDLQIWLDEVTGRIAAQRKQCEKRFDKKLGKLRSSNRDEKAHGKTAALKAKRLADYDWQDFAVRTLIRDRVHVSIVWLH